MTEDEAKTKWCPFARVVENGKLIAAHNRVQKPTGDEVKAPIASYCIGSACMAWRWMDALRGYDSAAIRKEQGGFCGLAGAPQ